VAHGFDSLVNVLAEPAGENCEFGGQRIEVGLDDGLQADRSAAGIPGDGILDADEVTSISFVCNGMVHDGVAGADGVDGEDGHPVLVSTSEVAPNTNATDGVDGCVYGGKFVEIGLDNGDRAANDGVLDADEVDTSFYVCNGREGDAMHAISGNVAPGSFLSLEINEENADLSYYAQVIVDDRVIDYADFSATTSPLISQRTLNTGSTRGRYSVVGEMDNGNFAIVYRETEYTEENNQIGRISLLVVTEAGETVLNKPLPEVVENEWGERDSVVVLASGDLLIGYHINNAYTVLRYSAEGVYVSTMTIPSNENLSFGDQEDMKVVTVGEGYGVMYTDGVNEVDSEGQPLEATPQIKFDVFNNSDELLNSLTYSDAGLGSVPALEENSNGTINALIEVDRRSSFNSNDSYSETRAWVIKPDGTLVADKLLSETYSYLNSISSAPNGNWICSFEYGGPDSVAYAVLDAEGEFVRRSMPYSNHEPTEVGSIAFPDGTFAAIYLEDDSLTANAQYITNSGTMIGSPVVFSGSAGPGYDRPFLKAVSNNEFVMIGKAYSSESGLQMVRSSRGYLELRRVSPTEARLYNFSATTVEAVLSAD